MKVEHLSVEAPPMKKVHFHYSTIVLDHKRFKGKAEYFKVGLVTASNKSSMQVAGLLSQITRII